MPEKIKDLIMSVSKSLKDYGNGSLSYDDAKDEYQRLLQIYRTIEKEENVDNPSRFLEGLCYYHNMKNFSIFSGVYRVSNGINPMAYYSDDAIHAKILSSLNKNIELIKDNPYLKISSDKTENLSHDIYVSRLYSDGADFILFIAASSSEFFSMDIFSHSANIFKELTSDYKKTNSNQNNYYNDILNQMRDYLLQNIDGKHHIIADVYIFRNIEKIFLHLGIYTLLKISNEIYNIINTHFNKKSKIYIPSMKEYIVLSKQLKQSGITIKNKRKIEFNFQGITIPYQTIKITIDSKDSLYKFLNDVFMFESYVLTGDMMV